ncbi:hypothetical protein [Rhodococcus sp. HS-D2]|uniref:hypothetical protein n=1 Tax=Rhodococcus sp. HS-D2 TaxID=1384636 RepID=UPI0012E70AEA|nr:hypothetical protein [Rhodococcus sp. HS-D2]
MAARSFPVLWSGVTVPAVFVVLAALAATPQFDPPPGRWRTGYTAVAALCVVTTLWMPAAVQVAGALTVLGVKFALIGSSEHLPTVRWAGLMAIVIPEGSAPDESAIRAAHAGSPAEVFVPELIPVADDAAGTSLSVATRAGSVHGCVAEYSASTFDHRRGTAKLSVGVSRSPL